MEAPSFSLTKKPREQQMLNVWKKSLGFFSCCLAIGGKSPQHEEWHKPFRRRSYILAQMFAIVKPFFARVTKICKNIQL